MPPPPTQVSKKINKTCTHRTSHMCYQQTIHNIPTRRRRSEILKQDGAKVDHQTKMDIMAKLKTTPLAIVTKEANEQHYEVPAAFYDLCLGPCKKYSSGLWPTKNTTFDESEIAMLDLYCQRAELEDGMKIVDLGCGWGSLTLHICKKYPNAKITSISNSHSQKEYILNTARERGLNVENITVVTCDVSNDEGALDVVKDNDRVCSVEMLVLHFIYFATVTLC